MAKKRNNRKTEERNKSLLGKNTIFTPEVIDDIHIKAQLGRYRMRGSKVLGATTLISAPSIFIK